MGETIKREEAGAIARKLTECERHLQKDNIFSCLVGFEAVLVRMLSTKMLATDEKELINNINIFQQQLAASKIFRDVYGPVTFRDNDIPTALDFMKQLIEIKEEETRALLDKEENAGGQDSTAVSREAQEIRALIDKGEYADAREKIGGREEIITLLVDEYNAVGIEHRRAGCHDEAIAAFKKALLVLPQDEGLFYNLARAYIGKKAWPEAAEAIGASLQINADFTEGIKLLKYIREQEAREG